MGIGDIWRRALLSCSAWECEPTGKDGLKLDEMSPSFPWEQQPVSTSSILHHRVGPETLLGGKAGLGPAGTGQEGREVSLSPLAGFVFAVFLLLLIALGW